MTVDLKINVVPVGCDTVCDFGKKQASATSCQCIPIETVQVMGTLYESQNVAVDVVTKIVLQFDEMVTLRQWSVHGQFMYAINLDDIQLDCL
jgi:hypothetical protein